MLYCWSFKKNIWCLLHLYFKSLKPHYVKLAGEGNGSAQRWKIQDALKTPGRASYHPPPSAERGRTGDQREATLLFKLYSSLSLGLDTFFSSDYTFSPRASYSHMTIIVFNFLKILLLATKMGRNLITAFSFLMLSFEQAWRCNSAEQRDWGKTLPEVRAV